VEGGRESEKVRCEEREAESEGRRVEKAQATVVKVTKLNVASELSALVNCGVRFGVERLLDRLEPPKLESGQGKLDQETREVHTVRYQEIPPEACTVIK